MDKGNKGFFAFSVLLVLASAALAAGLVLMYVHSSIETYRNILIIIISATIIITVFLALGMAAACIAFGKRRISGFLLWGVRLGLKIYLPFATFAAGFLGINPDRMRNRYIELNNIYVRSRGRKYAPEDILLLLPHCLQDSGCSVRIAAAEGKCRKCGNCCMGEITELVENTGVRAAVVTGGTAARNIVGKEKPCIILSVACERDLMSGIADVAGIPVIGIPNERPNGPCVNTRVNVDILKQRLYEMLDVVK